MASSTIYNIFFRRNSSFYATIFVSAFFAKIGFDVFTDSVWKRANAGLTWDEVKPRFLNKDEDAEDDE
ncbi:Ubiquinol-cytochrome C reductase [Schizosaccharomyces pombe]|uniref:Cytochrome b-c1 complex subunit 9 n=1 Tax=Schizosaccharomyces pombe (strain 972 / ATCC 24843) TaxID=284812 RepID=QCR9_SCHPO|nr:RecName: Full=Cytochrome b-c1 complex subunit 9; AltName: Full=Complex III subunit 9; AltName: Full=Cytochrome c1 non-heme 7.3 kDa protein; AltName: Full=Ubiquinol-cytochrome c reductase complex 7.3 kDa protein [Schizosaccharomyces pombe 972h-]8Q1B_I Chain I, Cytochrome b-c1 complex subunit 9 [Schizosaccharomyces pombe]8Q1B_T Chain T, Cytochrome b-c1 complex subunit 9 [Schizosaccharomyces pombe]